MRKWKIALAGTAIAVPIIAFVVLQRSDMLTGGTAAAAPNPATIAMPVPVTKVVKKEIADLPGLFGAHGVDP